MGEPLTNCVRRTGLSLMGIRAWSLESSTHQVSIGSLLRRQPGLLIAFLLRWLRWVFLGAILLASCGNPANNFGQRPVSVRGTPAWAYSLAGPVAGSPVLLALVTNQDGLVLAYACDGEQVAEWFVGTLQGQSVDLTTSDGARLQVGLAAEAAQGVLTLPSGLTLTFQISLTTGQAGLYRAKQLANGVVYLGGWVLLADGRQAGVIQTATQWMAAPQLDPAHPTISLPGGGALTPQLVTPQSDL